MKTLKEIMNEAVEKALNEGMNNLKAESERTKYNISKREIRNMVEATIREIVTKEKNEEFSVYVNDETNNDNSSERAYGFNIYKGEIKHCITVYLKLTMKKRKKENTYNNSYEIKDIIIDYETPDKTLEEIWNEAEELYIKQEKEKREKALGDNVKKFKEFADIMYMRMLNQEDISYLEYSTLRKIIQNYRTEMEKIAKEKIIQERRKEFKRFLELYCKLDEYWENASASEIEDWEILSQKYMIPCSYCDGTGEIEEQDGNSIECRTCYGKGFRLSNQYYDAIDTLTREEKLELSKKIDSELWR